MAEYENSWRQGAAFPAKEGRKKHYKAMVVGKSGAGKSTFINMVANLYNNRKYDDPRLVAITQGFNLQADDGEEIHKVVMKCNMDQFRDLQTDDDMTEYGNSLTQKCSEYTFDTGEYLLTLVDTPGLGDGTSEGSLITNEVKIVEHASKMGSFDAIILLYKGDDTTLDLSISELQSIMPKDYNSNLIVVFSHVSNPTSIPGIKHLQDMNFPTDKIVIMENECYLSPDLIRAPTSESEEDRATRLRASLTAWNRNTKQYGRLVAFLAAIQGGTTPLSGQKMNDLRQRKLSLQERVNTVMALQGNRTKTSRELRKVPKEISSLNHDAYAPLGVRTQMEEIITEHRALVSESILPPSDPLENRLEMEILELQEKVDRKDPRAAQELEHMENLLKEYNDIKDEMGSKDYKKIENDNGTDQHQINTSQHEVNTSVKIVHSKPYLIKPSSHPRPPPRQHSNPLPRAQYNPNSSAYPTNQNSNISSLDGGDIGVYGCPPPQPAQQRAAPGDRPIENRYDGPTYI